MQDFVGQKFNHLTVLSQFSKGKLGLYFNCLCDCGREKEIKAYSIRFGTTRVCALPGCEYRQMLLRPHYDSKVSGFEKNVIDGVGKKYNYLQVISHLRKDNKWYYSCICDCGNNTEVLANSVKKGLTKSCGKKGCTCCTEKAQAYHKTRVKNNIGQKFNHLTVLDQYKKNRTWFSFCRCDCGIEKEFAASTVRLGYIKTCGTKECKFRDELIAERLKSKLGDYVGKRFNSLLVLDNYYKGLTEYFLCRCDCSAEKEFKAVDVRKGRNKTCTAFACRDKLMGHVYGSTDYIGKKFGRLTVLKQYLNRERYQEGHSFFKCLCDCGVEKDIQAYCVLKGLSKSCGCLVKDIFNEVREEVNPLMTTKVEKSSVFAVLINMGYADNGRKIGVLYLRSGGSSYNRRWAAIYAFQGSKPNVFWFSTYNEALQKRLEIQEEIYRPFIERNKELLANSVDIEYWFNRNSDIEFDWISYELEKQQNTKRKKQNRDNV